MYLPELYNRLSPKILLALLLGFLLITPSLATGEEGPEIKLSPRSVNFGKVSGSKSKTVKIQNKGDADLEIREIETCAGTSDEFTFAIAATTVAPNKKVILEVTYTPADDGSDEGCLEITSNDTSNPTVALSLRGSAKEGSTEPADFSLRPDELDFGNVLIGEAASLDFKVLNRDTESIEVVVDRCDGTSDEYVFSPTDVISIEADDKDEVEVTYSPLDEGSDDGCLEVRIVGAADGPAILTLRGAGVESVEEAPVDLDIHDFKVKKEVKLDQGQEAHIQLWVKNRGSVDEPRVATVLGTQNEDLVYEESLEVSDRPGNKGVRKYRFPEFTPAEAGDVLWLATIEDDDSDVDEAHAVTRVTGSSTTVFEGVDLDIRRFRVTKKVRLGDSQTVQLRLWVINNGTVDQPGEAIVLGMQDGGTVYENTFDVSDSPGDDGVSRYRLSPLVSLTPGEILWMVMIDDEDGDVDEAFGVTRVSP